MGEYWVSHKRMNADDTRIIKVKAMEKLEKSLSASKEYTRSDVVSSIEKKNNWITCTFVEKKENKNIWRSSAEIHIIEIRGNKFIRTDRNQTAADNLGELPEF